MAKYYNYDKPFVVINSDGSVASSINVCAGPYDNEYLATSEALVVFLRESNIPDGLSTKIWKNGKLENYTWYNGTWNRDTEASSSDFDLRFVFYVHPSQSAPNRPANVASPSGWSESVSVTDSGYLWMTCAKFSEGVPKYWADNYVWKTPMLLGKIGINQDSTVGMLDLEFIFTVILNGSNPVLDRSTIVHNPAWTKCVSVDSIGAIWMSCARKNSSGGYLPWPDGKYWKEPMYLGYTSKVPTEEEEEIPEKVEYIPVNAFKKVTNLLDSKTSGFLNRHSYDDPPSGWLKSSTDFNDGGIDGYVFQTTARKNVKHGFCTWADGYVWSEPVLINTIGDPEKKYKPTNIAQLKNLFGLVQCTAEGVPLEGLEFDTEVFIYSDGNLQQGLYRIYVNDKEVQFNRETTVSAGRNGDSWVTCKVSGNTMYFYPQTSWSDPTSTTLKYEIRAVYGDIECRTTYMLAKVPAGESIQGIEGSVIRYRGLLKNLKAGDVLCYKVNEEGEADGVTYIDYVKASPSEFYGGNGDTKQTYYLYTGKYSNNPKYTLKSGFNQNNSLNRPNIGDFEEAKTFQFIATDVLLAENALIKNLQSNLLFFYKEGAVVDDEGNTRTDYITGAITGDPSKLGKTVNGEPVPGNYMIFGGHLDGDASTWINPNFRVDANGFVHIRYSEDSDPDSFNYKGYIWELNLNQLLSQYIQISGDMDDLTTKYSTFHQSIDDITARVEKTNTTLNTYKLQYAEWKLTVDGFNVLVGEYNERYGKILEQYADFQVTAREIKGTVTEIIDKLETWQSEYNLTARAFDLSIKKNENILSSLGITEDGIDMVGNRLTYKPSTISDNMLECSPSGLYINGNITAQTLTAGNAKGGSYLSYTPEKGLVVRGNIEATSITFAAGSDTSGLDNYLKEHATVITNSAEFQKQIDNIKNLTSDVEAKVKKAESIAAGATSSILEALKNNKVTLDDVIMASSSLNKNVKDHLASLCDMSGQIKTFMNDSTVLTEVIQANYGLFSNVITDNAFITKLINESAFINKLNAATIDTTSLLAEVLSAISANIQELTVESINGHTIEEIFEKGQDGYGNGDIDLCNCNHTSGHIAGWVIETGYLHNEGSSSMGDANSIWLTPNGNSISNSKANDGNDILNAVISAGDKFVITSTGDMYAASGKIANWNILENLLYSRNTVKVVSDYLNGVGNNINGTTSKDTELFLNSKDLTINIAVTGTDNAAIATTLSVNGLTTKTNINLAVIGDQKYDNATICNIIGPGVGYLGRIQSGDAYSFAVTWNKDGMLFMKPIKVGHPKATNLSSTTQYPVYKGYTAFTDTTETTYAEFQILDSEGRTHYFMIVNGFIVNGQATDGTNYVKPRGF